MNSDFGGIYVAGNVYEKIHAINYLTAEIDAAYHQASRKLGLSDSVSRVLYTICDTGEGCLLSDIYKKSGTSKQTVNSAIRQLEREGMLYLAPHQGRSKRVMLTEQGRALMERTAARIYEAENLAFSTWQEAEIDGYIAAMERFLGDLRRQFEAW